VNVEPSLWDKMRWQGKRGWPLGLVALISLSSVGAMLWHGYPAPHRGDGEVQATISGFAPDDAPKFGRGIIVTAKYRGLYGERDVQLDSLKGCRVGDPIRALRRGSALVLYPMPC
jgi:hypothetical protein